MMAQDCAGGRYRDAIFTDVLRTNAIAFGSNTGVSGGQQVLYLDVYRPVNDPAIERPVVIVAFGGSFISGNRNDVEIICNEFARRGYVAVAPDYRIGLFEPDPVNAMLAVMRATHDLKACVRYLRRSVAEEGNPWNIDPDRIIVGGVSAGAIAALHATYLNEDDEFPPQIAALGESLGGVEGLSGNAGYPSSVAACYSFSGAIGDTSWIDAGAPPLASIHDIGDQVVPYYTQEFLIGNDPIGLVASGSHDIHLRLEHLGIDHCLLTYPGNGHVSYLLIDPFVALDHMFHFTANMVCGEEAYCGAQFVDIERIAAVADNLIIHDPVDERIIVGAVGEVMVIDVSGRLVLSAFAGSAGTTVHVGALPPGIYTVRVGAMPMIARQIMITD